MTGIVVVGASLAGLRAVEAVRRLGYPGPLSLIGEEKHFPPYDRPPLSKQVLAGDWEPERARLRAAEDLGAELLLGRRAVALDVAARRVRLDDGTQVPFDGVILATGAQARTLPFAAGYRNVVVLRTVDDALDLRRWLTPGARVGIVGAGVLGCEIAATCRRLGHPVALVDVLGAPMVRVLGPELGEWLAGVHARAGVELHLGRAIAGLRGEGLATGIELQGGEVVPVDVVVIAVGAAPATAWLAGSGLMISDGVVCDSKGFAAGGGRRVVAAGDVARWWHPLVGAEIRVEHWTNAAAQARVAATNLVTELTGLGDAVEYRDVPYAWSDQYQLKVQIVGLVAGARMRLESGAVADGSFVASYRGDGDLVGFVCVNAAGQLPAWRRRLIEQWTAASSDVPARASRGD